MRVLFDYRKVRKTRSQTTTMIELDTFLRNEENKKDMYNMRCFYVVMPVADGIVKFGIAGAKDGKSGAFGRLAQYVHQYGVATDLNQYAAQYCNTTICQEYLSVYLLIVNATFWDSLTDEQREMFHTTRRSINEEAFTSDKSANEALLTQLRAGGFPGITESTLSEAATTELKALTDAYVAERIDSSSANYNATMKAVWDVYNSTSS